MTDRQLGATRGTTLQLRILLLTLAVVGLALTATVAVGGETQSDEQIEVDENVSVWTGATYAMDLKNPTETEAMNSPLLTGAPTRSVDARVSSGTRIDGETNQPVATVIEQGSLLQFEFDSKRGANTEQFAGTDTSLVVAKVDSPDDPAVDGVAELSPTRAVELLSAADRNSRASFETQFTAADSKAMRTVDKQGAFRSYYRLDSGDDGGIYALYTVETIEGEGVVIDNGDLTIDGKITVLGVETVTVGDGSSTVNTESEHTLGEPVDFEVTASGNEVDHTVAVFDESALAAEQLTMRSDRAVDEKLSPTDVTVDYSATVQGVAKTESASVFGATVTDSPAGHASDVGILTTYLATAESDGEGPAGSITATTATSGSETISVETLDSWSPGEYTYIHIATADDGTTTATSGQLSLDSPSASRSRSSSSTSSSSVELTTTDTDTGSILTIDSADAGDRLWGTFTATNAPTALTDIEFDLRRSVENREIEIRDHSTTPQETPPLDSTALSYHSIETDLSETDHGPIQVQFTVDDDRRDAVGAEADEIRLYTAGDSWTEHDTEPLGDGQYTATVPGFSTVAIGSIQDANETLTVSDAALDSSTVQPNERVDVTATVENPTADDVAAEIELTVDGEVVETVIETVPANDSLRVNFGFTPSEPGNYSVHIAGDSVGSLEVTDQQTTVETPGFGILLAVVSLVALLMGASRLADRQ